MKLRFLLLTGLSFALILTSAAHARANLSSKQARTLITKAAGMSLPSSAVRVGQVEMSGSNEAEATADVDLVFRLTRKNSGWRVSELRIGPDRWEELDVIANALGVTLPAGDCDRADQFQPRPTSDISVKRARCLIAELFGVELPSDAVRIKSLSGLGIPLASEESAITVAQLRLGVRFVKAARGWQVSEVKSGSRNWKIENLPGAISEVKRLKAIEDMKLLSSALDEFRRERGSFVVTDKHPALIDHLSPRYLARVIRLDPWHNPYQYQGERAHFTLRSAGPDGKLNTGDDVVLSRP